MAQQPVINPNVSAYNTNCSFDPRFDLIQIYSVNLIGLKTGLAYLIGAGVRVV